VSRHVVVLPTGTANLASVLAAFARLGATAAIARAPAEVAVAERLVLPGVGTFGATMAGLRAAGLDAAIAERARGGAPILAMCVGLQVLFEASDESPGSAGLGVLSGRVGRFPDTVRVPSPAAAISSRALPTSPTAFAPSRRRAARSPAPSMASPSSPRSSAGRCSPASSTPSFPAPSATG
jgi:CobB/CobQ-like glutamine amidotransferase domain